MNKCCSSTNRVHTGSEMKTEENPKTNKVGLVVLFNHNYEKNIPLIKNIYRSRFPNLRILMPFYYGNDEEVIGVYGNSFTFQTYIAQARDKIMAMNCDSYLIIGDDVYLNPDINNSNLHSNLSLSEESFYIDSVCNVSLGEYSRPILEATRFNPNAMGLDPSVNRLLPTYDEAYRILQEKGVIGSTRLSTWKIFFRRFRKPFLSHLAYNRYVIISRCYHILRKLQYWLKPVKMRYPYVFGYSDLIVVPATHMKKWCQYLEIFATWGMFVEMAIPTAMLLLKQAKISFSDEITLKTGNVWYPYNPSHQAKIEAIINELYTNASTLEKLAKLFPKNYLYLHPVKLSRYAASEKA